MSITVTPAHPDFVAEIAGVDVSRPLNPADRQAIEDAIDRYAVVVFRGQTLDDEQQVAFARNFGPIAFLGPEAPASRHQAPDRIETRSPTSPTSTATATC